MFTLSAKENASTLQLVQGMQEIKLNGAEYLKRWEWENIQSGIFKLNFRSLSYSQIQQSGALLINQGKDVLITFRVAGLVVKGQITLGGMLAIQYIIGQLNGPIEQLISFVQSAQDAKISMERLNDIHNLADEEKLDVSYTNNLPSNKALSLSRLSFAYPGTGGKEVISNLTLNIPVGCVTAIVGYSGSGKTTLLKLLLKFYDEYGGTIKVGDTPLEHISHSFWRKQCGAVLQDGFVFNDTIANNIAVGETSSDYNQLIKSARTANILEFIESLPNGFHTQLGAYGIGISQGQKQRLLIARAVYKNPQFIFFDEATNALDASNERTIVENLTRFFKGRTVVVVAHRLSTVKHADNIIVLHQGNVVEQGTHEELSLSRGLYFELVKDQLELANN
jgi:ATP-binding cassette subfamily B protein